MIYCENVSLQALSVAIVGNRLKDEGVIKSDSLIPLNDRLRQVLVQYFMASFKSEDRYAFFHHSGLEFNFVHKIAQRIFNEPDRLLEYSAQLVDQLYEMSGHSMIKSGEFYVAYFRDVDFDGNISDAIGLFKSENKDVFLRIVSQGHTNLIEQYEGVDIRKLDKGCLIFNQKSNDGYVVAIIDNSNKTEAKYWVEDFLNIRPIQDKYFQTRNFMTVCKNFVSKQMPQEFEVSKADQIELLNKSVKYFKEKDEFNIDDFSQCVLEHPELIDSFKLYKDRYQSDRDMVLEGSFEISTDAVKKQSRGFKSVIKLDKNFHIYVHGDRRMIEQGEDEKGRYYKVYFKEEF